MGMISGITEHVNGVLWGAPMIALMLISGAYFSARTGFMQLRRPREWLRRTVFSGVRRERSAEGVTPFQAMSSALAATLGTGNIAGVAAALASGGAGAVFWMWVSAMLGMMTGYAENLLGNLYRRRKPDGGWQGGAMYYIRDGLSQCPLTHPLAKPLAAVFAGACVLSAFGMGNLVQMNCAAQAMESGFGIPGIATGIILAAITGANPFSDVPGGAYYNAAVRWAVKHGNASGTDAEHFSPAASARTTSSRARRSRRSSTASPRRREWTRRRVAWPRASLRISSPSRPMRSR